MRPKWEKWGYGWEALGTDGDADNEYLTPDVLQLIYLRFGDKVLQLAYVLEPEVKEYREMHYMKARNSEPKRLEVGR